MPEQITDFIQNALPIIGVLAAGIFCLILLIRLIVRVLLYFAVKNYKAFKKRRKKKNKLPEVPEKYNKEEDERFIKKEEPGKDVSYEIIPGKNQQNQMEKPEIVDIVKPVGFWTSMVLGQKLTYLVSSAKLMNENKKGFWTSMVEAQARAQGRERGRGRF